MAQFGFFRRSIFNDVAILACIPFFALTFTRMNLGPSGVDPWLYFGYGTNFDSLLTRFGWTYYAARLPWNAATRLFFSVFQPNVAIFLLGMTVSSLGSISLYAILRFNYSRPASLMGAVALQANSWYLGHSFWLYVDSPAISISLLCIALLLHGIHRDRTWLIVLAGMLFAIGVNIHPMVLILVLAALFFVLLPARTICIHQCLVRAFLFCFGGIFVTLIICTASWWAFGNFFYFMTTVTTTQFMLTTNYGQNYQIPFFVWADGATALALPLGVLCCAIMVFAREFLDQKLKNDYWMLFYGTFLGVLWLVADLIFGVHVNQHTYYFIYLWVPAFLIFGGLIDRLCDGLGSAMPIAVIGSIAVPLLTLVLAAPYWQLYLRHPSTVAVLTYSTLGLLLAASIAAFLLARLRTGAPVRVLGILSSVAFVSVASATDHRVVATSNFELYPVIWFRGDTTPDLMATVDAQHFIKNNVDPKSEMLFWYNKQENRAQEYMAICASFRYWFLNEAMPALPNTSMLGAPANLIMLATDASKLDEALSILRGRGFFKAVTAKSVVGSDTKQISVWIVATRSTAEAARFLAEKSTGP